MSASAPHGSQHWLVRPEWDARPGGAGQLRAGHTLGRCRACEVSATVPPPAPLPPVAVAVGERPTARVAGDPALAPTLRPRPRLSALPRPPRAPSLAPRVPVAPPAPALPSQSATPAPEPTPDDALNVRQAIVLALASLGDGPVSVGDLVVACWRRFPARFGLAGHVDAHPDSAKVQAKLSGAGGLADAGLVTRPEIGRVVLTPKGRALAARLAGGAA